MGQCVTKRYVRMENSENNYGDEVIVIGRDISLPSDIMYNSRAYINLDDMKKVTIKALVIGNKKFVGIIDSIRDHHDIWYNVATGIYTNKYSKPATFTGEASLALLPFKYIHVDWVWIRYDIPRKYLLTSNNVRILTAELINNVYIKEIYIAGCPGLAIRAMRRVDINRDISEYLQGDEDYIVRVYYLCHINALQLPKR